jgi:TolB-like protein/DNA-binding winged helix-turn-helix (wHTH) protein/Tfp pilus assembly protein PilF
LLIVCAATDAGGRETRVPTVPGGERYCVGDLVVDVGLQRVSAPSGEIVLPKLSFDLLLALARRAPAFVSNDELAALVWAGVVVSPETVTKRVNLLREALGDDAASPRYIAGLRSRGYRIVAPVTVAHPDAILSKDAQAGDDPDPAPAAPSAAPRASAAPRFVMPIVAGLVAVIAVGWWVARERADADAESHQEATATAGTSVAVLAFENLSPTPEDAYLAVGIPEMILDRLSAIPRLTVIASGSAFRLDDPALSAKEIGRRLGAMYLVLGSAQRAGDQLRVTARLVDARSGTQLWSTQLDRRLADLFDIQDIIAAEVADELRRRVQGGLQPRAYTRHEPRIEAQLAFLQARAALARHTVRGSEEAARKFAHALELDPRFAAALAGLFDARMLAAERRHDDVAAERRRQSHLLERALEIDQDCGPAYVARAIWGDGDAARREADFRRGLELDPSSGRGLVAFSEFLDRQGRYDEATSALDRAMLVDPLSPRLHFRLVMREFPRKGVQFREAGLMRVLEIDPDYQPALQRYGKTRWILHGKMAEAAQILEHAIEVDPDNPWSRHTTMALYLDLADEAAAREVAFGTESSKRTGQLLLALYRGDTRTAGEVALSPAGREYNLHESWGATEAVRDYALQTGDFRRAIGFLEERYRLGGEDPELNIQNFRAAACLAQLLRASGNEDRARRLLDRLPAEIDASIPTYGAVFALRTKASVQLLAGDPGAALGTLAESFASGDVSQWWYTLEHDPLWQPLQDDPVFKALAAQVHAQVVREQTALAEMRRAGRIVARGSGTTLNQP